MFKKDDLIGNGFIGFYKVSDIREGKVSIPKGKGVYIVYRDSLQYPEFMKTGTGGHYKGKNPNVDEDELKRNWVDGANLLYIGETGSGKSNCDLYSRINLLIKFGYGKKVGHWGGRYIWQLSDSSSLLIAYKTLDFEDPREVKIKLLESFIVQNNGILPFANLKIK